MTKHSQAAIVIGIAIGSILAVIILAYPFFVSWSRLGYRDVILLVASFYLWFIVIFLLTAKYLVSEKYRVMMQNQIHTIVSFLQRVKL